MKEQIVELKIVTVPIVELEIAKVPIVCNEFKLVSKVTGSTLELFVVTDLPDDTVVMVSVSRSYWEKGSPDEYSVDYLSEKSTIGKWKLKQNISIAGKKWENALKAKQEAMSGIGFGFDVANISDKIEVRMVVPINQSNPIFGKQNSNLTGRAVSLTGMHVIIEDEIEMNYPLVSMLVEK